MKTRILVGTLAALLGITGAAQACHRGSPGETQGKSGLHGKITGVNGSSFTMSIHRRSGDETVTVDLSTNTVLTGASTLTPSLVGEFALVQGSREGNVVDATSVTIHAPGHHKGSA